MTAQAKITANRAQAAYPPTGQLLDVNGTQVHAHIEGSGPDLIMLHGASGNTREFTFSMAQKLAADYRVIAFDRPGHGHTDRIATRAHQGETPIEQARLLKAAADQLGAKTPIVLGQSYGGAVALAYALEHPDDLAALVMVAGVSNPWPGEIDIWYRLTNTFLGRNLVIPLVSAFVPLSYVENSVQGIFKPDPVPQGYFDYIGPELSLRTITLHANTQQVNRLRDDVVAMYQRYETIRVPAELVHGTEDKTVPLTIHSIPLSQQIPGANLTTLDGTGHMPHHAAEDQVIAAIHRAAKRAGLR